MTLESRPSQHRAEFGVLARIRQIVKLFAGAPWSARIGAFIVLSYAVVALFASLVAPYGQSEVVSSIPFEPWGGSRILGTDQLGRDLLSRLIFATRNSVGLACLATLLAFVIGSTLGIFAAVTRGWLDVLLSRLVDGVMAIPSLIFALILLSIFGSSVLNLLLIIAFLDSTRVFRVARAVSMNVMAMDFVEAARLRAESFSWIASKEILPNILPTLSAEFGLRFCYVFLTVSALSFLGLGVQPPTADLGSMVRETSTLITYGDVTPLIPAGLIALLTVSINYVVDWFLHISSGLKADEIA